MKKLTNYLIKKNIPFSTINNEILLNRKFYHYELINWIKENTKQIDSFYLDSNMILYINKNII